MSKKILVHLLPHLTTEQDLKGATVVVIDVLRATTTITQALSAGAGCVIPCLEIDEARERAKNDRAGGSRSDNTLLGGERDGLRIEGFDLGNSPEEYQTDVVRDQTIVFTTTNGTQAMQHARLAKNLYLAAFTNVSAICEKLAMHEQVHLICAGTNNKITLEDSLLAGLIVDRLCENDENRSAGNDQAIMARDLWKANFRDSITIDHLIDLLTSSHGGQNVSRIKKQADIITAAQIDHFSIVPKLDIPAWEIRVD